MNSSDNIHSSSYEQLAAIDDNNRFNRRQTKINERRRHVAAHQRIFIPKEVFSSATSFLLKMRFSFVLFMLFCKAMSDVDIFNKCPEFDPINTFEMKRVRMKIVEKLE
jgi:hypothetical protein